MGARPFWQRVVVVYVGLFVIAGGVFGLLRGVLEDRDVSGALVDGVLFGLVMSAVLGTIMVVGQRGNRESWSPRRRETITVPDGLGVAHDQTLAALARLHARVTHDEPGRVTARTRAGMRTWGQRIDVTFEAAGRATAVRLAVYPRVPTLIDYGAAQRVVDTMRFFLTPQPR